jgi:dGTPase
MMKNPLPDSLYHSREHPREPDLRGDYFRDQTAIIHATPFRRLKHKTQVFFSPENDHICTRIEHVLHVSTIATTICKGLDIDVELAQAIALGHDLGHAPFGHSGERVLDEVSKQTGGFIHEVHSLRVVDRVTRDGWGLNLTYAVRDGIVSHCGEEFQQSLRPGNDPKDLKAVTTRQTAPLTYEACVVRVSDKIAYLGRDIEDAITTGLITEKDVPKTIRENLGTTNGEIIDTLVMDIVSSSTGKDEIRFSGEKYDLICQVRDFNYERIYNHPVIKESDRAISGLIHALYNHLLAVFQENGWDKKAYLASSRKLNRHFWNFISTRKSMYQSDPHPERCVVDFVAGMTDSYALNSARDIILPKPVGTL